MAHPGVSTYLGGSGEERGTSIAVGEGGRAHVVGFTVSLDLPTVDPLQLREARGRGLAIARDAAQEGNRLLRDLVR